MYGSLFILYSYEYMQEYVSSILGYVVDIIACSTVW